MSKACMKEREKNRRKLAAAGKYPKVRLHNRCNNCGRPRGYYRFFGLCRLCLRDAAHAGILPGVVKSSW